MKTTSTPGPLAALQGAYWLDSPSAHQGEDCGRCAALRTDAPAPVPPAAEPPCLRAPLVLRAAMTVLAAASIVTALLLTGLDVVP
ncbi:hypothetical protein [Streptomyces sp. NPDC086023]|uniref:hypothetical protein n=1 Tax=Streptomyces sp. NPDC086023 TaxID=3365746 RepID=UPI0037CD1EDD